jgi:hypothetical protein
MITSAADFEFAFVRTGEGEIVIEMSPKHYPEYDQHIGEFVAPFWPKDIVMDEVAELSFVISEELTEEQVKEKLVAAGFEYSQAYQDLVDEHMGL